MELHNFAYWVANDAKKWAKWLACLRFQENRPRVSAYNFPSCSQGAIIAQVVINMPKGKHKGGHKGGQPKSGAQPSAAQPKSAAQPSVAQPSATQFKVVDLVSFKLVFGLALFIRLLLVAFAEWQDANSMSHFCVLGLNVLVLLLII